MTQQVIVRPIGLVTQPNKHGVFPPGALAFAHNVRMRDPGLLDAVTTFLPVRTDPWAGSTYDPAYLMAGDTRNLLLGRNIASGNWQYSWENGTAFAAAANIANEYGVNQPLNDFGRVNNTLVRGRTIVNTEDGVMVFDGAAAAPRQAGLLPPFKMVAFPVTGGALPGANYTHLTCIIRRKSSNGYELSSAPAFASCITNGGNVSVDVYLVDLHHKAGDIVEVYRTRSQVTNTNTNTGADYYLSASHVVTSAEAAAAFLTFTDVCNDATLGEALYTNSGQQGAAAAHWPPPKCRVVTTFKGHTFYMNRVDPPTISFRNPVYTGFMGKAGGGFEVNAYARQYGIGSREGGSTATSGNPTLTAVPAADIVGVVIGQTYRHDGVGPALFPIGTKVTAVGATTITFAVNALASQAIGAGGHFLVYDIIEIDGQDYAINSTNDIGAYVTPQNITLFDDWFFQLLDRVLPDDFGSAVTNPQTVAAEGVTLSRFFSATGRTANLTIRATNGNNYVPQLPRIEAAETARQIAPTPVPNGISWSEQNQPEHCPLANTTFCGSGDIYGAVSTRDAVWIFASDGLWRLSGTGGEVGPVGYDWRLDPIDSTLFLGRPQMLGVYQDTVFAYTNRGLVSVSSAGDVTEISTGRVGDWLPGKLWSSTAQYRQAALGLSLLGFDETNHEIHLYDQSGVIPPGGSGVITTLYNVFTDTFTTQNVGTDEFTTSYPSSYLVNRTDGVLWIAIPTFNSQTVVAPNLGSFHTPNAKLQPVYGDNPYTIKHWQQVEYTFANLGAPSQAISPVINAMTLLVRDTTLFGDAGFAKLTAAVPRNAPAIANQIAPGFTGPVFGAYNSTQRRLYSIGIKFEEYTDQRMKR